MSIKQLYAKLPAVLVVVGLAAATPPSAAAQAGVSLVPWVGAYIPTKNKISDIDNALSRDVSVIGGARLTFWGTGVLGFEATGGYAPAKIANETINETGNTNLLTASGRLLLALSPVTNRVGVYLGAGPALLARARIPSKRVRARPTSAAPPGWASASPSARPATRRSASISRTTSTTATSAVGTSSRTTSSPPSASPSDWVGKRATELTGVSVPTPTGPPTRLSRARRGVACPRAASEARIEAPSGRGFLPAIE